MCASARGPSSGCLSPRSCSASWHQRSPRVARRTRSTCEPPWRSSCAASTPTRGERPGDDRQGSVKDRGRMMTAQTTSTAARAGQSAGGADHAITADGLTQRYGTIEELRGVDLAVPRGALFGLVGPNGAGKSTLIKAIVGALRPTAGEVRTLGLDP